MKIRILMTIVRLSNNIRCFKYNFSKLKIAQIIIEYRYIFNKFFNINYKCRWKNYVFYILKFKINKKLLILESRYKIKMGYINIGMKNISHIIF